MATSLGQREPVDAGARQGVIALAQIVGVGQFASQLCPSCEGGTSRERTLSLDVGLNGVIKFHCHRAGCDFSGSCYQSGLSVHRDDAKPQDKGTRPFTGDLHPLSKAELAFFKDRYGIIPGSAVWRTHTRYALSIFRPNGSVRGYVTRRPYEGSPADTAPNRADSQYAMKALTYMEADEPVQSWYGKGDKILLVEDSLSAIRAAQDLEVTAVAILGTGLNAAKVQEIQREAGDCEVLLALDADATGQAFAAARKWHMAFKHFRVIVLSRDIKDSSSDELSELPI